MAGESSAIGIGPGATVDRYRIDAELGRGGMGTVYKAVVVAPSASGNPDAPPVGAVVAVKALHPEASEKPVVIRRFRREAKAAMTARHPNIVRVLDLFEHGGMPMLAMEYLEGDSLEKIIERKKRLSLEELASVMVRVTSAVGTAHALGIVHRDLKPDNIFIVGKSAAFDVKVLDFGIAKFTATEGTAMETAALTRTGALVGTPFYMSPEQAFGEKQIDQRADVWALGMMLYRCLSGVLPTYSDSFADVFRRVVQTPFEPVSKLVPELPPDVADLVMRMLERDREKRPWDLREVHTVLEQYANVSPPSFGEAVAPAFEDTVDTASIPGAASIPQPAPDGALLKSPLGSTEAIASSPLRLTPGALRGAPAGGGTLALDPRAPRSGPAPSTAGSRGLAARDAPVASGSPQALAATTTSAPAKSSAWIYLVVLIAIGAAAVVVWRSM